MNKDQYLKELKQRLAPLSKQDRDEILFDYQEHFDVGLQDGKSEIDIINELGTPHEAADNIMAEMSVPKQEERKSSSDHVRMVFLAIILIMVNLIFVVGPAMAIIVAYLSLYSVVLTLIFSPMLIFYYTVIHGLGNAMASFFAMGIGISLGVLIGIGLFYVGKWIYQVILMYINFNVKLVRGY
ncbi:DUF1700 domain-containing protein [Tenuibacillus multivorans]|uniref:Uncharacterized membrane protein n=1 Tax=Tenuibacillus multivorans TaxID=237069 RepID=A0A1G9WRA2_9BACI|nr:DUF1700 domain-containing protein [Tenuibacillus multivorans]GEL77956.1 hypothetical protein TMU01_21910 [Tenuibacillus multivorans]SDM87102.1 Uncharacterized membrane protein [Tenuibacillus multivorans]